MTRILMIFFLILSTIVAYAKDVTIEAKGRSYLLDIPAGYKFYNKFLALENVVMGPPDKKFGTSSLSVTFTSLTDSNFDSSELEKSQKLYQDGRNNYIKERRLKLVDFIPYKLEKTPQGHLIHTIGVVYSNGEKVTLDKSYMIENPQSFIHAKFVGDIAMDRDISALKKKKSYQSTYSNALEKSILGLRAKK